MDIFRKLRKNSAAGNRRGAAMLEVSLMLPIVSFLFVGALDLGCYSYALISLENAARVAALYTSTSSATASDARGACRSILGELQTVPNVGAAVTSCSGGTLTVNVRAVTGSGGLPASQVSVTYQTRAMIPIPGSLLNRFTWTRTLTMPLRS